MATERSSLNHFFPGGSEMARRMRELDWSKTTLGPIERWPASLVSTLSLCMSARFPMAIYWGRECVLLYNDAWRPILGDKQSWALGSPAAKVWPEIWDVIAPLFESVFATGEATWRGDALLPMQRFGYTEECYFDYTFNPIRGQSGEVEGILNVVQETTYRVLNERRTRLQRELALRCAPAKSEIEACKAAMAALATDHADVPFALLYRIESEGRRALLIDGTGLPDGSPALLDEVDLSEGANGDGWPLSAALRGETVRLTDLSTRFGALPGGPWPELTTQACVSPIVPVGQKAAAAVLVAGVSPRRALDDDYLLFYENIAASVAGAFTNAKVYEEEQKRIEALAQLDRAKTAFFSNVSHEFRTPLTLILGPAEELLSGTLGETNDIQQAHLTTLRGNALRLQKLVNTLLEFARVEAGRLEASYEPVDIGLLTREIASTFCSAVHRAGLLYIVNCPSMNEPVYVDRDMWEKIVLNLLSNALKFTFEGAIEISVGEAASGGEESGEWRVASGESGGSHARAALSRTQGMATGDGPGGTELSRDERISEGGAVQPNQPDSAGRSFGSSEHRGGSGQTLHERVPPSSERRARVANGIGDSSAAQSARGIAHPTGAGSSADDGGRDQSNAFRAPNRSNEVKQSEGSGEWRVASGESPLTTRRSPLATHIALTVRDTGAGIDEKDVPSLFQRFHRLHSSPARTQEGSGIGLALVQELVKLHGGHIQAESAPGEGTAFTVFIPKGCAHLPKERIGAPRALSSTALGAAPFVEEALRWLAEESGEFRVASGECESPLTTHHSPLTTGPRVLIADDNRDMRRYIKRLLDPYWNVTVVDSGVKALEIARTQGADLVLSDIMMPGLDGFELLRELRADQRTKTVPVILLSARAGEEAKLEGLGAGADDYLVKPFTAKELLARVEAHLKLHLLRREAEKAVRESEERYRHLVRLLPVAMYTCEAPSGAITFYNGGAAELWRRAPDIGDLDERFCGSFKLWRPDGTLLPHSETPMAIAVRQGREFRNEEVVIERPDGSRITVLVNIDPIRDESGRLVGAINVFHDTTALKEAEQALRRSEERFRRMADSSPVMIWLTDVRGKVLFLNRTSLEFFGVPADETAATFDWTQRAHPEDMDAYLSAFQTALSECRTFHYRVRLRRHDGAWRWFESRGNPMEDEAGNLTGFIGSCSDITEIYESQQRLRELDQRKDEFLANMSHEIRSPLTGIMGYADVLLSTVKDAEQVKWLRTIKESGNYLIEIVNDILDLSKIEAGKLVLNMEAVSPHEVLGEIHGLMDVRAREKELPLVLRYEGVVPVRIETDRTRLRQIVINLVSNAIKFTELGQVEIVVRFLREEEQLQVEVIDTGIGIGPEHQAVLFQPFTQADSTSTRRYGGTGLGLTITKRLVEMLGGSISFKSELGKGSTFCVTLPTAPAKAAPVVDTGKVQAEEVRGLPLSERHVLVVDDRKEFCYLVSRYIEEAGGRATAVTSGEAALDAVQAAGGRDPFHAVIMDIQMPGLDGYDTTRRLRAKGFRMPIIALTAGAMVGDREKCLRAGCDDYLTKPIDRRALVERVAYYAQRTNGKPKVLVVDDSHSACEMMRRYMEKRGYEVRVAYDGETALRAAEEFYPDVVVLDIRLPDMNGYELMRRLRGLDGAGRARFIGVSGYRDGDPADETGLDFDHFLEKPLDLSQLETVMRSSGA